MQPCIEDWVSLIPFKLKMTLFLMVHNTENLFRKLVESTVMQIDPTFVFIYHTAINTLDQEKHIYVL